MPSSSPKGANLGAVSYDGAASDESRDTQRLGYQDVANGLPFCHEYDGWKEPLQRDYEIGRMLAWMVLAHNVHPKWRDGERAGQMLRRLLGQSVGTQMVQEINQYIARDKK